MRINAEYVVKYVLNGKISQISLWYIYKKKFLGEVVCNMKTFEHADNF